MRLFYEVNLNSNHILEEVKAFKGTANAQIHSKNIVHCGLTKQPRYKTYGLQFKRFHFNDPNKERSVWKFWNFDYLVDRTKPQVYI